jgi:ribosome maturation factor RimP
MREFRTLTAWGVVFLMSALAPGEAQTSLPVAPPPVTTSVKQQLTQLGVGAKVNVKLAGGVRLSGAIQSIDERGFSLHTGNASATKTIAYDQLAQVKLAKITYHTSGPTDAIEVRRVVTYFGAGKHIQVRTTGRQEYHGNIQSIEQDHFTMLPDFQTTPVRIAYSEVVAMGPNLSKGAKIAIVVVVGLVAAAAIVALVALHDFHTKGI